MFSPPPGGATDIVHLRRLYDTRIFQDLATITREIFTPGPTRCGLSQNTQHFTILQSELALPSTGRWLPSRLSSTWRWKERIGRIFPSRNTPKKRDILSEKRESGMVLKKREFTPESGTVDTNEFPGRLAWLDTPLCFPVPLFSLVESFRLPFVYTSQTRSTRWVFPVPKKHTWDEYDLCIFGEGFRYPVWRNMHNTIHDSYFHMRGIRDSWISLSLDLISPVFQFPR